MRLAFGGVCVNHAVARVRRWPNPVASLVVEMESGRPISKIANSVLSSQIMLFEKELLEPVERPRSVCV